MIYTTLGHNFHGSGSTTPGDIANPGRAITAHIHNGLAYLLQQVLFRNTRSDGKVAPPPYLQNGIHLLLLLLHFFAMGYFFLKLRLLKEEGFYQLCQTPDFILLRHQHLHKGWILPFQGFRHHTNRHRYPEAQTYDKESHHENQHDANPD